MKKISLHTFKHTLRDIHKNTENRKFCFIIGAGASFKSGIPTGGQLAEKWFAELNERYLPDEIDSWIKEVKVDKNDLASNYGSIYRKRFESDKTSGYEFLVQAMRNAQPTFGHFVLAQVLSKAPGNCVLTTNFDSLIESAIYQFTNKTPLVCGHESLSGYARPSHIHPLIVKIHRDLLLSPKSDIDEISKLDKGWEEPLNNIFNTHIPIVIGYGGNDESLMTYFEEMKKPSNFFWCIHKKSLPSTRVQKLVEKMDGSFIEIEGFDEMMKELLWVFDEIEPVNKELHAVTKSRIAYMTKQLEEMDMKPEPFDTHKPKEKKEISAFEYAAKAEQENDLDKRKTIYLEAIEKFPKTAWLWGRLAYFFHLIEKDYYNAEKYYLKALSIDPENVTNIGNYALLLHEIAKDHENAEKYYLKALSIDPENAINNGNYANFLNVINKDFASAEIHYLKALKIDPENANINGNYAAFLHYVKKDFENAEKHYIKALSIDPDHANSNGNYADFLKSIKKEYKNAEKHYIKALALDPEHANYNGNYAVFLDDIKKDFENAEKHYSKVLANAPDNADNYGNYARFLLCSKNELKEAKPYIDKAFELNNNHKSALLVELWFYRYAHYPEWYKESEKELDILLKEGISSPGWNLDRNVEVAIANGHPHPEKLRNFARLITE